MTQGKGRPSINIVKRIDTAALDRCVLYVYRLAVYFAEGGREPEKIKWWNWKDTGR